MQMRVRSNGSTVIDASLYRCTVANCFESIDIFFQSFPTGFSLGETKQLAVKWNPLDDRFIFVVDFGLPSQEVIIASYIGFDDSAPPVQEFMYIGNRVRAPNCTAGRKRAAILSTIDNVLLNPAAIGNTALEPATNEIFVIAVSGSLVGLNGTYAPDCIPEFGGGSFKEIWVIHGNTINTTTTEYESSDCTTVTTVSTLSATFELAGTDINIVGWVDDQGNNPLAPLTANNSDGDARLSDTESVSPLEATIIATTGPRPGPSAGSIVPIFFVVDDTGANNILYGADDDYNSGIPINPKASISNPLIKQ